MEILDRLGSLSKAAEEISYTPSAFSRMLTSLEEELGVNVLTRSSNGVKLSEAGKTLYPRFVSLVKEEEALLEAAKNFNSKADHTLCVATYPSISRNLLSKTIKDFHALYQNIKLSIKVIDDLTGILENGEADIIFADGVTLEAYDWTLITTDRYLLVTEKGLYEDGRVFSIDELYSELKVPYIHVQDKSLLPYVNESKFGELLTLKSEDDLSVIDMIKTGMGASILPQLVVKGLIEDVSVWEIEPSISRNLGFARKQGKMSYALNEFVNFLEQRINSYM